MPRTSISLVLFSGLFSAACRDHAAGTPLAPKTAATIVVAPNVVPEVANAEPKSVVDAGSAGLIMGLKIDLEAKRHKNLRAYCRDYEQRLKSALAAFETILPKKAPACREIPLRVPYAKEEGAPELHAVALEEGLASSSLLLAEDTDGIVELPIRWAVNLRSSSVAPQHGETLDELRFEQSRIIAVVGLAQGIQLDAGAPGFALRRGVVSCAVRINVCHTYFPDEAKQDTFLGIKVRPWDAESTRWETLPWTGLRDFAFEGEGMRLRP